MLQISERGTVGGGQVSIRRKNQGGLSVNRREFRHNLTRLQLRPRQDAIHLADTDRRDAELVIERRWRERVPNLHERGLTRDSADQSLEQPSAGRQREFKLFDLVSHQSTPFAGWWR